MINSFFLQVKSTWWPFASITWAKCLVTCTCAGWPISINILIILQLFYLQIKWLEFEKFTIKEAYISVDEKIYTDSTELTKYLLFGSNNETKEYTVVQGDTIDSVAFANQLSASELIIANDDIDSTENILAIGQKLNVALIKPILTLIYEELVVEDVEEQYKTEEEKDDTQYTSYKQVKQKGANGINRITSRVQFLNGEKNEGVKILSSQVIKPAQSEIIVRGTKRYYAPSN